MRFMMIMIPKVYQPGNEVGENFVPPTDAITRMMRYNEELSKAGALLALDGLQPPKAGARVKFAKSKATVTDGPFAEAKEVIGGFWIIQVKSKEEAVEWARKCPADDGDMIEIRPLFEMADFPPDAQKEGARIALPKR